MNFPSGWELVIVVLLIMVLFGYKKLPDATRSLGKSMRIFKAETQGLRDDDAHDHHQDVRPATGSVRTSGTTTASVEPRPLSEAPLLDAEQQRAAERQAEPHQQP